ncbi:hypothetical protein A2U01_0086463, partial [Trifolium medium]|nr:hypothetical protein [Trifolium medium]
MKHQHYKLLDRAKRSTLARLAPQPVAKATPARQ